ncbi:hypothetical protein BC567DRAFT_226233 [Phyllosticta citribraziliensis]
MSLVSCEHVTKCRGWIACLGGARLERQTDVTPPSRASPSLYSSVFLSLHACIGREKHHAPQHPSCLSRPPARPRSRCLQARHTYARMKRQTSKRLSRRLACLPVTRVHACGRQHRTPHAMGSCNRQQASKPPNQTDKLIERQGW